MKNTGRWIRGTVVAVLVTLVLGRWAAVRWVDRLWYEALGVSAPHLDLYQLRTSLILAVLATTVLWCVGNLYLVFQSIDSVQVPRRMANLEIVETLPRRYLGWAVVLLGMALAVALAGSAGDWWVVRAVANTDLVTGLRDPVLNRDAAYYLFRLPWYRLLHGFATLASGVILGVVLLLYVAVGAVRIEGRRLLVSDLARRHLGGVLATFAAALAWGYQLEAPEYVAGIQYVPIDAVLTEVRIPTSRLLSAFALTALAGSLLWVRYERIAVVGFGWIALAAFSVVGHYVVPSVAARARPGEELRLPGLNGWRSQFSALAYGLPERDARVYDGGTDAAAALNNRVPAWDAFAAVSFLNKAARSADHEVFTRVHFGVYDSPGGPPAPVLIAVPEIDLNAVRSADPTVSWDEIHSGAFTVASGAVAIRADSASDDGFPLFVPDLRRPDSVTPVITALELRRPEFRFTPAMTEFAVDTAAANGDVAGVSPGGVFRRIALAWRLQTTRLLTLEDNGNARILWNRGVTSRLERYAPFLDFESAFPVVTSGAVTWLAFGYVSSKGFPLSPPVDWRGATVRYLRAGFVGTVDASTGATSVYLLPGADPMSQVWAVRFPELVRPPQQLGSGLRSHLRYPEDLFDRQLSILRTPAGALDPSRNQRGGQDVFDLADLEPFWWWESQPVGGRSDQRSSIHLMAGLVRGDPSMIGGVVEGVVENGGPALHMTRFPAPLSVPAPPHLTQQLGTVRGEGDVGGPLKILALGPGPVTIRSVYSGVESGGELPRLTRSVVAFATSVGEGQTPFEALLDAMTRAPSEPSRHPDWETARAWVGRLDTAMRNGDWRAFGEAYGELVELFQIGGDSAR